MTAVERVKRNLVRAAVQENLELIQGLRPSRLRARRWTWRRPALALAAAVALGSSVEWRPFTARATAAGEVAAQAGAATAGGRAGAVPALPSLGLPPLGALDPAVLPLAVRTVVLDPGHGGTQLGTVAPGGLIEKDLTLDIAERLRERLEGARFRVLMTRESDTTVELQDRAAAANAGGGDIFVSVHLNWIETRSRGVETYYLGATDDPYLTSLAAAENRDSGYSYADTRRLLDGIYAGLRREESRRLAQSVQERLHHALRAVNPSLQDRGVKTAPFLVLVGTGMPAILAEVSCLSNDEEVAMLRDPGYRQRIADALFAGITGYAGGIADGGADSLPQKGSDA